MSVAGSERRWPADTFFCMYHNSCGFSGVFVQQKAPEWAKFYRSRCQEFSFVWRTLLIGTERRLGKVLRSGGAIKRLPQICSDVVAHIVFTPINDSIFCHTCANVHASSCSARCSAHLCGPAAELTAQGRAHAKLNPGEIQLKGLMRLSLVNLKQVVKAGVRSVWLTKGKLIKTDLWL